MNSLLLVSLWYGSGLVFAFVADYINLKYLVKDFSGYGSEEILPKFIFALIGPIYLAVLIYVCLRAFAGVKKRSKKENDDA